MTKIVTSASMVQLIKTHGEKTVIGRAIVAIYRRQTREEQDGEYTINRNGVGFTAFDAKVGSLTAEYYLKYNTLLEWHVRYWMKPTKAGYPRVCRYARQLNEVAESKVVTKQTTI